MTNINKYKPRYTLSYLLKTKIWPYKDSYLRNFFRIRARWVKPKGKVQKYIRVAKNIKWSEARNFFRPNTIQIEKKLIFGKSAYGRPQAASRRYNNLFYIKQKLRFFHGKVKENHFRNIFKTHIIKISVQTNSFFVVLESRLDRIFFRIRLLPTVFACHQFIHYNGLEINNKLEKSPRKEIKVGDIITVPAEAWINFYWYVYYRIYYRRWGRYVLKCRLIKKVKKLVSLTFYNSSYKSYKSKINQGRNVLSSEFKSRKNFYIDNKSFAIYKKRVKPPFWEINEYPRIPPVRDKTFDNFMEYLVEFKEIDDAVEKELYRDPKAKSKIKKRFELIDTLFPKIMRYYKIYFNLFYLYKGQSKQRKQVVYKKKIKRKTNVFWKGLKTQLDWAWSHKLANPVSSRVFNKNDKKLLISLFWKRLKKKKRNKITIRLKPVHFFIPAYLQMDFRTLSIVKIKSPIFKDRHYPFQISLSKTYSFYKSQGFLLL